MTYTTPPVFTVGEVAASSDLNILANNEVALAAATFPIGIAGAAHGTPPPPGPGFKWQAGYLSTTTDGSGGFGITFPTAFTGGVIGTWFSMVFGTPFTAIAEATSIANSGLAGSVINTTNGAAVATTPVTICWFAIGF